MKLGELVVAHTSLAKLRNEMEHGAEAGWSGTEVGPAHVSSSAVRKTYAYTYANVCGRQSKKRKGALLQPF